MQFEEYFPESRTHSSGEWHADAFLTPLLSVIPFLNFLVWVSPHNSFDLLFGPSIRDLTFVAAYTWVAIQPS